MIAPTPGKQYIGDGVYVSVRDHFGDLLLETERDGLVHWIVLEPVVYDALRRYVERRSAIGSGGDQKGETPI